VEAGSSARGPNGFQRAIRWIAGTRPGAWVLARTVRHIDSIVLGATRQRRTFTSLAAGVPVIELTTVGARSGRRRSAVVLGIPLGESVAVVAGDFGARRSPSWMHNLLACPEARIAMDGRRVDVTARLLHGSERASALAAAIAVYPPYARYAGWTDGREIGVFLLEPNRADGAPRPQSPAA
jgi:deazaflavin-dependent oxidoreductase (nitroreductase family)